MVRRIAIVLVLLCSAGFGTAGAECALAGVAEGIYVKSGTVEILATSFGTTLSGPATVCDDGTAEVVPSEGSLSIRVNGVEVCSRSDLISADPFGFSLSIRASGGACGADISVGIVRYATANGSTVTGAYPPHETMLGRGLLVLSPATGSYWIDGGAATGLPAGHPAWFVRGVSARTT